LFPLLMGQQATPYLQATEAVIPPPGQAREELDIYLDLARACGAPLFGSRLAQGLLTAGRALGRRPRPLGHLRVDSRRLLSGILRAGGAGGFDALVAEPHGRLLAPPAPGTFLGKRVPTPDGRVHLAPRPLRDAAGVLEAAFEAERRASGLRLITRRAVRTHNSWTHNLPAFVAPERGWHENHVYLHPRDAAQRGLAEGDLADVTSATGRVRLPVRLCEDLVPGAVALPHGWGHQGAPGLRTASRTAGVNANLLAADGRRGVDPLSGMVQLTAIDVDVRPAAGPRNPASWSGL